MEAERLKKLSETVLNYFNKDNLNFTLQVSAARPQSRLDNTFTASGRRRRGQYTAKEGGQRGIITFGDGKLWSVSPFQPILQHQQQQLQLPCDSGWVYAE